MSAAQKKKKTSRAKKKQTKGGRGGPGSASGGGAPVGRPWGAAAGLLVLRLWAGGFFLATAEWKLNPPGAGLGATIASFRTHEYVPWIQRALAQPPQLLGHPLTPYTAFLEHVMLPGAPILAPLVLFGELLLGISLVLGLGVRLSASLGFLMMLSFTLAKPDPRDALGDPVGVYVFSVGSANWPVTLILLALALTAAGRSLGLDLWLRARGPRWLRWAG